MSFSRSILAGCLVGLASVGLGAGARADTVRLGFMSTLSGPVAENGAEMKRGFDIAMEELGGKIGGQPTQVFTVDDKGQTSAAVRGLSELVDRDQIQVLTGPATSNIIMAVAAPAARAHVFFLSANGGPNPLAGKQCSPWVFSSGIQNDAIAGSMGIYLKDIGKKNLYLMGMDYQAGRDMVAAAARTYDGHIAGKVFTPMSQFDFASQFARLQAAKPDSVFAFYVGGAAISFVKQYAQLKQSGQLTAPLYSPSLADPLLFKAEGDAALGINLIDNYNPQADNSANRKLVKAFEAKYGREPSHFAALQYDAVMLLDSAVRAVGGDLSNKDALRAALAKADFKSVRGDFKFNSNHFPIQDYYVLQVKKNPKGQLYMAYVATATHDYADPYAKQCPMK